MKGLMMYSIILIAVLGLGFSCEEPEIEDPNGTNTIEDTTYYINNQADFDRLNGLFFPAGSTIALAAGETFKGRLLVRAQHF